MPTPNTFLGDHEPYESHQAFRAAEEVAWKLRTVLGSAAHVMNNAPTVLSEWNRTLDAAGLRGVPVSLEGPDLRTTIQEADVEGNIVIRHRKIEPELGILPVRHGLFRGGSYALERSDLSDYMPDPTARLYAGRLLLAITGTPMDSPLITGPRKVTGPLDGTKIDFWRDSADMAAVSNILAIQTLDDGEMLKAALDISERHRVPAWHNPTLLKETASQACRVINDARCNFRPNDFHIIRDSLIDTIKARLYLRLGALHTVHADRYAVKYPDGRTEYLVGDEGNVKAKPFGDIALIRAFDERGPLNDEENRFPSFPAFSFPGERTLPDGSTASVTILLPFSRVTKLELIPQYMT